MRKNVLLMAVVIALLSANVLSERGRTQTFYDESTLREMTLKHYNNLPESEKTATVQKTLGYIARAYAKRAGPDDVMLNCMLDMDQKSTQSGDSQLTLFGKRSLARAAGDADNNARIGPVLRVNVERHCEKSLSLQRDLQKLNSEICEDDVEILTLSVFIGVGNDKETDQRIVSSIGDDCDASRSLSSGLAAYFVSSDANAANRAFSSSCKSGEVIGCHFLGLIAMFGDAYPLRPSDGYRLLSRSCSRGLQASCKTLQRDQLKEWAKKHRTR